jgi:phycocyanin alpha chain
MKRLVDEEIIANAQAQGRFLTESEMQEISAFSHRGSVSLTAARKLVENSPALVEGVASEVFRTSSSDSRSFTSAEQVQYTRGIEFCLLLITYGLIASSADLDEIAKNFRFLKLESKYLLMALQYIGSNHGLTGEEAREVNVCINHLSHVVSAFESESRMNILKQLQEHFAKIAPGVSLADELIAERREEARRELGL